MYPRTLRRDAARGVLWGEREVLLPHLLGHSCPIVTKAEELCIRAQWTYESYLMAVVFDDESLIVETSK